ncbi:hypothetical protein [Streptomyces sp. NPDC090080]|uniref:hypothetical protein n=1 Tax=Streptomyces sp. NPDC090080 TaxID=3365939 RepID=UPI00380B406F
MDAADAVGDTRRGHPDGQEQTEDVDADMTLATSDHDGAVHQLKHDAAIGVVCASTALGIAFNHTTGNPPSTPINWD